MEGGSCLERSKDLSDVRGVLSQTLLSCCIADVLAKNKLSSKSMSLHEYRRQDPPTKRGFSSSKGSP